MMGKQLNDPDQRGGYIDLGTQCHTPHDAIMDQKVVLQRLVQVAWPIHSLIVY